MPKYSTIMAFDYGTNKIGVAVGQYITKTATPLAPIPCKNQQANWELIDRIIAEWQPDAFVVGFPTKMDGSWQKITTLAQSFMQELNNRYAKRVYATDERLSSKSAKEAIFAKQGYKGLKKISIDGVAASIILEQWFQEQQSLEREGF